MGNGRRASDSGIPCLRAPLVVLAAFASTDVTQAGPVVVYRGWDLTAITDQLLYTPR
jgi:hypothetical protein